MTAAVWAALLLAPLLGRDPAANTRAIQAALDAAGSRGGGTVALTEPGVYDLAAQGPNPYHPGHRYCLELRWPGTLSWTTPAAARLPPRLPRDRRDAHA